MPFWVTNDDANGSPQRTHFIDTLAGPHPTIAPRLLIAITTYRRSASLYRMLDRLTKAIHRLNWRPSDISLLILEDPSQENYGSVRRHAQRILRSQVLWLRAERHLGKAGFWRTYQAALAHAEHMNPELMLFLQDDLEFELPFLSEALDLFASLKRFENGKKRPLVLNLYAANDDEPTGRWVNVPRRDIEGLPARQTQWFDLAAFLLERSTLKKLNYRVHRIPEQRWRKEPLLSSGVGRQLTRRLRDRAITYQCFPPLVFHGSEESCMNPEVRASRALDNRNLKRGADSLQGSPE